MNCPYINGLDSVDYRFLLVVTQVPGNLPSSLLSQKIDLYLTLARFSIACISRPTGTDIRSTSIEAVGIDVTYRRRSTAFVNI